MQRHWLKIYITREMDDAFLLLWELFSEKQLIRFVRLDRTVQRECGKIMQNSFERRMIEVSVLNENLNLEL